MTLTLVMRSLIHFLLYSGLPGLSGVKDELLEILSIYQLLELSLERATINSIVPFYYEKRNTLALRPFGLGGSDLGRYTQS